MNFNKIPSPRAICKPIINSINILKELPLKYINDESGKEYGLIIFKNKKGYQAEYSKINDKGQYETSGLVVIGEGENGFSSAMIQMKQLLKDIGYEYCSNIKIECEVK